jgi:hypothetical protein
MRRKVVTLDYVKERCCLPPEEAEGRGIMALVDVENMGWCKDDVTRWYTFELDGEPCIYFKH